MMCTRCGRKLKNTSASGMGPVCELAVLGPRRKSKSTRRLDVSKDTLTIDMFAGDLQYAQRVEAVLSGISMEMR